MSNSLIDALLEPGFYDHPVASCELIETHISWVILAGDYAYKIKKPVDFGFLDFSTLEKRQLYCQEEVRLNRRLAANIYLDVVAIHGSPDQPHLSADGPVIEYMVKMRRFEQACQLDHMLESDTLTVTHIDAMATMAARFHEEIDRATASSTFGSAEKVYAPVEENFEQIRERVTGKHFLEQLVTIKAWCKDSYVALGATFEQRKANGYVRECHGDMHLRNLAWIDNSAVAFDCIEFNPELRWIDVMSEIAFLIMDLQEKNQARLAQRFLNTYLQETGDYDGLKVLRFYLVYRALVRAKINAIRLGQEHISEPERTEAETDFTRYLDLALEYTQPRLPLLMITHGVSASGKSTVTQSLLENMGAIRIRSDVERKRLFSLDAGTDKSSSVGTGIYTADATQRTYDRLAELAGNILDAGYTVIVDATFQDPAQRVQFKQLAKAKQVGFVILFITAPDDVLRQRILERSKSVSDADLGVLEHQLAHWQPHTADETSDVIEIDTSQLVDIPSFVIKIKKAAENNRVLTRFIS